MKKLMHLAIIAASLAGGTLMAQQPSPAPTQPRQPGPPGGTPPVAGEALPRRQGPPPFGMMERLGPGGIGMAIFSPTVLLERRQALNLTPDQVTRLSTLENDARAAREKAETDAKPHRDELQKLMEQSTPDVAQLRTHAQAMMQAQQTGQLVALTTTAQAKAVLTPEQRGRVQGWADARRVGPGRQQGAGRQPGPRRPGGFGVRRAPRQM